MYKVELNDREQKKLFSYMAETYPTQPANDLKHFIAKQKREEKQKCLIYPAYGKFNWTHNDDIFEIEFFQEGEPVGTPDGADFITRCYIFNHNLAKIQAFIEDIFNYVAEIEEKGKEYVKLYISRCNQYCCSWDTFDVIKVQSLENIFMDKNIKSSIIQCIDKFNASEDKYVQFGRKHKLNLLLSGIPGSGKTSLCKALAKKYGYSIYIINFNKSISDEHLINLTSDVKNRSIILYEDIDVFFTDRLAKEVNVTFSCLINILDGTLTKGSGNINIITTNHPERIDPALLRPGRIDKIVKFDYPKKDEIREAFRCLITEDEKSFTDFYHKISHIRLTMSAIINYLFNYQEDYLNKENITELISQHQHLQEFTKEDVGSKLYT